MAANKRRSGVRVDRIWPGSDSFQLTFQAKPTNFTAHREVSANPISFDIQRRSPNDQRKEDLAHRGRQRPANRG